ncbi:hypothetical protein ACS0TY_012326 [Phlomoides rotata]
MDTIDEDAYAGTNDGGDESVNNNDMLYGFDGDNAAIVPPTPPPLPSDGFLNSPMKRNNDMHTPRAYGSSGSPYNSSSPFNNASDGDFEKPYDVTTDNEGIFTSGDGNGPLLPDPSQMREEGTAFREWRRQNMAYLEEKEKKEKEMRNHIIAEADEWKQKFYEKRAQTCENNKAQNRERQKLYYAQQEKFHKEADNQFWKAIAEIIPREVPNIEKRRSRKDDDKKPSILVIQGPKPGKPTDMSRMRQMIAKLKVKPPLHMVPPPPPPEKDDKKDSKDGKTATPPKDGKEKNEGALDAPSDAGEKPVTPAKGGTPKADESAAGDGEGVEK